MMTAENILPADSLNGERIAPADIPTSARGFRDWGYAACCEWPKELQAAAFYAQEALEGRATADKIEQFRIMYTAWFAMPERQKFELICSYCSYRNPPHPARLRFARQEALNAARRAAYVLPHS